MKFQYELDFRIDLSKAVPAVGDLVNGINTHLALAGYDEQIKCNATVFTVVVTVDRELSGEEEIKMKEMLQSQVSAEMPKYNLALDGFRRKSGNVSQSVL